MASAACCLVALGAQAQPATEVSPKIAASNQIVDARPWPREYSADGIDFAINQPQIDSWESNILKARVVMAVKTGETKAKDGKTTPQITYGVAWLQARTETDKEAREVTLHDLQVERGSFPTAKEQEAGYLAALKKVVPSTGQVMSLDVIESALAINGAVDEGNNVPVNNTAPEIIFSFEPALLVPIDGEPVWRPAGVSGVEHVLNSRFSILRYQNKYYIGRGGRWGIADSLQGTWARAASVPGPVSQALSRLTANDKSGPQQAGAKDAESTRYAAAFVRTRPAELIVVDGEPAFDDIEGTSLSFVTNTPADVFLDSGNNWYVLISGRWFTAQSTKGPWTYLAPNQLPADFAKIPSDGPKGAVLASIAGTPEARESLVANSVPQTATVNRKEAKFTAVYDGPPRFEAIAGTSLSAAKNTATPVIKVSDQSYVALDKGVWFVSTAPTGPWDVATAVPAEVYSIPTASPLHYVTYVKIYGSTDEVVHVGYTPGYYGTVASNGVVVYGTGYNCDSWVGNEYYGCPSTYGSGAAFAYGAAGWSMAFGWGYYNPWYYPWYYPYWGPWYYPGYWGGAAYAAGNIYGHWGNSVVSGTGAAWANAWTGNFGQGYRGGYYNQATGGRGYGYAGRNTNIYTGNTRAAAGGIRYNPETGRVVGGQGGMAGNIYTGTGVAGGSRTAINNDTGRVTQSQGGIARTQGGTTAGGSFNSAGAGGDAKGAGYVRYDRGTGEVNKGGVVDVNGDTYAGRNGNVYKYDEGSGSWSQVGGDGGTKSAQKAQNHAENRQAQGPQDRQARQTSRDTQGPQLNSRNTPTASSREVQGPELNNDRLARERGAEREAMSGRSTDYQRIRPSPSFDRGSYGGGFHGRMGGFRGGRGRF